MVEQEVKEQESARLTSVLRRLSIASSSWYRQPIAEEDRKRPGPNPAAAVLATAQRCFAGRQKVIPPAMQRLLRHAKAAGQLTHWFLSSQQSQYRLSPLCHAQLRSLSHRRLSFRLE